MKFFLFDIDGTLLKGFGPYETSLSKIIQEDFGVSTKVDLTPFHGLTDRKILRNILEQAQIHFDETAIERCLFNFGRMYPDSLSGVRIIPGVLESIKKLKETSQLGLVTGNVEEMARKKLRYLKLDDYFTFGGFGNESYERSDLVNFALERARIYGWNGDRKKVYLIGDTPRDVKAGLMAKVVPIAVTTGITPRKELIAAGAYRVIDNLKELI